MQHLLLLFAFASILQGADALKGAAAIPRTQARPHPSVVNPLAALSDGYSELVKEHYLPTAFVQAAVLASGADIATQLMEHSTAPKTPFGLLFNFLPENSMGFLQTMLHVAPPHEAVLIPHVLAMATVASTMSGGANALWLRQLEAAFPGKAAREVAAKTLIHAVILASIINSAYLVGVPLLTSFFNAGVLPSLSHPSAFFAGWTLDEFVTLTKLEVCMFIPYNTIAFKFVPPRVRPLTHAMVSATFNVAVSAVTLGYWDVWMHRVLG